MPEPYPREFGDVVVRVARHRECCVTLEQVAADFDIHVRTLSKWWRQADVDDGAKPRIRLLEQENEVLRRAAASLPQSNLSGK